jgi:NDP-sugar pyrophosphorylase family protein
LVPINGIPFLHHYLNWLAKFGAHRVILSLGYKADMVQAYVQSETWPGIEIEFHVESTPLGTGGAVRACLPLIRSETALVTNGDSVTQVDLSRFVEFHRSKAARVSLLLTHQVKVTASGLVATDATDAVTSFNEKPAGHEAGGFINAGIYLMNRDAIAAIPTTGNVSVERDVFPGLCGRGLYAFKGEFPFIDIGTPDSYRQAAEFFAQEAA